MEYGTLDTSPAEAEFKRNLSGLFSDYEIECLKRMRDSKDGTYDKVGLPVVDFPKWTCNGKNLLHCYYKTPDIAVGCSAGY